MVAKVVRFKLCQSEAMEECLFLGVEVYNYLSILSLLHRYMKLYLL